MTIAYTSGTISLVNGSTAMVGSGTAWQTALIVGGLVVPQSATGNALVIDTVTDNTHMTAAKPWTGPTGSYGYALIRDTAYLKQVAQNATSLADYISRLDNESVASLAALADTMGADKLAYATGANSMAWTAITAAGREALARTTSVGDMVAGAAGRPILVFASGQSNMSRYENFSWSPPANLKLWNHDPMADVATHVGNAFYSPNPDKISLSWSFAAEIALNNPDKTVYVVNTAQGGQVISRWLPGGSPDLYATGKANIEAALTVIGKPVELIHLWWQGESDAAAGNVNYEADFLSYRIRLSSETWWSRTTLLIVFGVSTLLNDANGPANRAFNKVLSSCVASDPDKLKFVLPATFGAFAWEASSGYLHMNALGYSLFGKLAYNTYTGAVGRAVLEGIVIDPETKQFLHPKKYAFSAIKGAPSVGDMSGLSAVFDTTGGALNVATGVFTVPVSGLWHLDYLFQGASAMAAQIYKNGANYGNSSALNKAATASTMTTQSVNSIPLVKGDQIKIVVTSGSADGGKFCMKFEG